MNQLQSDLKELTVSETDSCGYVIECNLISTAAENSVGTWRTAGCRGRCAAGMSSQTR